MRRAAAIDPGTSINSFALAIGEEIGGIWRPHTLREWRGSPGRPLDLRTKEGPVAARLVRDAGCDRWRTDQYAWADIVLVSQEHGLHVEQDSEPLEDSFTDARKVLHRSQMSLARPDDPELDALCAQLASELAGVTEKCVAGGKTLITLPTQGRRHADLARAWIRMLRSARAGKTEDAAVEILTGQWAGASETSSWDERFPVGP